ncbi:hypothetical protein PVAP13_4NG235100 [Panicum virgatum]|uniref:Uncharacterized protein n=1 Tax=Panicum virgatum TaxID=38727 RepID=A0A8T0T406_PANVG|nr:hypothetical protein PVAP13_4NG235100 [Panicum virgatum]
MIPHLWWPGTIPHLVTREAAPPPGSATQRRRRHLAIRPPPPRHPDTAVPPSPRHPGARQRSTPDWRLIHAAAISTLGWRLIRTACACHLPTADRTARGPISTAL